VAQPVIGITCYRFIHQNGYPYLGINEAYTQSIHNAGGIPVLIPLGLPEENLLTLLPRLDGVLFSGGGDVHPDQYGSQPHPLVDGVDEDRDRVEIFLLHQVLKNRKPFLGICRGLQVINVALGGSLYEDILDQKPNSLRHQLNDEEPRDFLAHEVQIESGSRLAEILQSSQLQVNSLHHQGIRKLADGLLATAFAPDEIIEAFELPDQPFGLAVQWHPEALQAHAPMRRLFQAFIQACQKND
jgi:putative glutamine amidotransferase